jgi:hypothetical protein
VIRSLVIIVWVTLSNLLSLKAFPAPISNAQTMSNDKANANAQSQENTQLSTNFSHDLYGISKSIWRKLGMDSEIDDGTEGIFREYAVYFLLFGGIFVGIIYLSLNDLKRK